MVSLSALAQPAPPPADVFAELNRNAIEIYDDAKLRFGKSIDPVIIAGPDSVLIRQNGTERRVGRIPPAYTIMKTVGHVPRSLWAALRPAMDGLDPNGVWRTHITMLRLRTANALAAIPRAGLSPEATRRATMVMQRCIDLLNRYLQQGLPSEADLRGGLRAMAPAILADATEAARGRLDAIDRDIRPWWNGLTQQQRDRAFVVILGAKAARADNLAYAYFLNLVGKAEDGHRVVYAEGFFDDLSADRTMAALVTDRRLSVDFFTDERRMERDLLGDGAQARLLELFGRLGTP